MILPLSITGLQLKSFTGLNSAKLQERPFGLSVTVENDAAETSYVPGLTFRVKGE